MSKMRSTPTKQAAAQTLVITRTLNAPRELVFKAWTEPEQVMRWWGPKTYTTPACEIELRLGGIFRTCMRSPEGRDYWSQGIYHEIDEPNRIVFSDAFSDEHGHMVSPTQYGMSDDWPTETIVTVSLSEHAGKTRLVLQHWPLQPSPERDLCQQGWNESLDKLAEYLVEETAGQTKQRTMQAIALDRFGGPETMAVRTLPIPEVGPDEILIRIESAGVGVWDPYEREGGFAKTFGIEPRFPYVLGSDGAGTVAAVGEHVTRFEIGDRVYGFGLMNPKGGFYAEYIVISTDMASHIPGNLTVDQAGAMPVDAMTALRGLDDTLGLKRGESLMIFGASGGIGHMAVQLAKRMGARVLAVASGEDGVALARRLGADTVVDGRKDDVLAAAREFASNGLDAALVTAGGEAVDNALKAMREGGRVAYPNGVEPEPKAPAGVTAQGYDGMPDPEAIKKLNRLIESGPFIVHIAHAFPLEEAADAHRALDTHYLGKLTLRPI
ncbi:MAG: SRPBCC domain-containing protein [Solirubrobacterales bacterium]